LKKADISLPKKTVEAIIENYTRESGVRNLEKKIASVIRKVAMKIGMEEEYEKSISVDTLKELLGTSKIQKDRYEGNHWAGVVTGLAWTPTGGDILFMETSLSRGKGNLTLTGNLGDVMKESAMIALEYVKAHAAELNINDTAFENWNIHLHVPQGAIPKDGPSAGIAIVTSIASSFTQRKVKKQLAMTGEITLRGKVLPVGGIKEKILAAKRAGIKEIIMCAKNQKDLEEINEKYVKGLDIHFVNYAPEVLKIALTAQKVDDPIEFILPEQVKA